MQNQNNSFCIRRYDYKNHVEFNKYKTLFLPPVTFRLIQKRFTEATENNRAVALLYYDSLTPSTVQSW